MAEEASQQETEQRQLTWIEQRMAEGRYTCSIKEFALLLGISYDRARELCKSRNAPPGIKSGSHFKVLLPDLPAYMSELGKKHLTLGD